MLNLNVKRFLVSEWEMQFKVYLIKVFVLFFLNIIIYSYYCKIFNFVNMIIDKNKVKIVNMFKIILIKKKGFK